jgi:Tfp pilus assembly protein PilW
MRSEGGYSLVELLVAMTTGLVVMGAIMVLINVTTRHQQFVSDRVVANQRARPVMTNLMNDLHSACVAPQVSPVQAGSTGTEMRLVSQTGSGVSVTPQLHVVRLEGGTLRETVYNTSGGTAPDWTFSSTPAENRVLLKGVTAGSGGVQPLFRYYSYGSGGVVSSTPLSTPLSSAGAESTVQVAVTFAVSPNESGAATDDANAAVELTDTAVFRLSAASEDTSEVNAPCV